MYRRAYIRSDTTGWVIQAMGATVDGTVTPLVTWRASVAYQPHSGLYRAHLIYLVGSFGRTCIGPCATVETSADDAITALAAKMELRDGASRRLDLLVQALHESLVDYRRIGQVREVSRVLEPVQA